MSADDMISKTAALAIERSIAKSMAFFVTVKEWEAYKAGVQEYAAAISALPAVTVGVRPLEFVYGVAESIVGNYLIDSGWKDKVGGERWWAWAGPISGESDPFYAWQHGTRADDEKAAKAAAQADYEARILAALDLTPAPDAQVIEDARLGQEWDADDVEPCGKCMGSGYGGHPDSGALCTDCHGKGGIIRKPAPDAAAIREATARLHKLAYWLDTDAEVLADMDQRDLSDHQHIQAEVNAILALIQKGGA